MIAMLLLVSGEAVGQPNEEQIEREISTLTYMEVLFNWTAFSDSVLLDSSTIVDFDNYEIEFLKRLDKSMTNPDSLQSVVNHALKLMRMKKKPVTLRGAYLDLYGWDNIDRFIDPMGVQELHLKYAGREYVKKYIDRVRHSDDPGDVLFDFSDYSFDEAFGYARRAGLKVFIWQDRKYNTDTR